MPKLARTDDTVERRTLETMFLVFCPAKGLVTTEPYFENAEKRAAMFNDKCFIIEAPRILLVAPGKDVKRVYKIERDRLHIEQEML